MAIKFKLPDGGETDLVAHSFNGFPSATAADLRDTAWRASPHGGGERGPQQLERAAAFRSAR